MFLCPKSRDHDAKQPICNRGHGNSHLLFGSDLILNRNYTVDEILLEIWIEDVMSIVKNKLNRNWQPRNLNNYKVME